MFLAGSSLGTFERLDMIKKLAAMGLLCALSVNVQAEDWPGKSAGALQFFVDQAVFKGSAERSLVEFYVLLEAAQLQYVPEDGKFVGEMDLSVIVRDSAGETVEESTWTRHLSVNDLSQMNEGGIPYRDVTGLQIPPGAYDVVVTIEDMFGDKSGQVTLPLAVRDMAGDRLTASDLILASSVKPAEKRSKFTKFGFDVIPNTTRRHLLGQPLKAYVELYNLAPGESEKSKTFVLGYSITDTSGIPVKSFPATRVTKPGGSAVKTLTAETTGLRPGRYFFEVEAFDSGSRQHIKQRRSVRLASPGGAAVEEDLTEDQLRQLRYYRSINPLASKADLKVYDQLKGDDQAQMKFLRQFWKKFDPTPGTDINERLIEHLRRMRHTDDNFSGRADQLGSETQMGRVYIQYGAPDDIERDVSGSGTKPWELWHYGRYDFVFQDRNSIGYYELVHSTHPDELNNPMWRESIF
jgi:GWxTD domain-containing protein